LYGPPSLRWTPFVYTPLYYYVCAALSLPFGASLAVDRFVSIAAFGATLVLLYAFARQQTQRRSTGVIAASLYAATYFYTEGWYDLARMDSLALALLTWGIWLAATTTTLRGAAACGLVLFAAYFTKQTMLPVALPAVLYVALCDLRRGMVVAAVLGSAVVGSNVIFDAVTDGWYSFYVWEVPRDHVVRWELVAVLWRDNAGRLTIAVLWALAACALGWRESGSRRTWVLFAGTVAAGMVVGITGLAHDGGGINAMMPMFAAVGVVAAVVVDRLGRRRWWLGALGWASLVGQLVWLVRDPRPLVPDALDHEVGHRLVAKLRAEPAPLWAPGYRVLATQAGHDEIVAHTMALCDIFKMSVDDPKRPLLDALQRSLAEHHWSTVVVGEDLHFLTPRTKKSLERHYDLAVDVFWPGFERAFLPPTGYRAHPRKVYRPDAPDTTVWIGPG
jgi:hypothetical protein